MRFRDRPRVEGAGIIRDIGTVPELRVNDGNGDSPRVEGAGMTAIFFGGQKRNRPPIRPKRGAYSLVQPKFFPTRRSPLALSPLRTLRNIHQPSRNIVSRNPWTTDQSVLGLFESPQQDLSLEYSRFYCELALARSLRQRVA